MNSGFIPVIGLDVISGDARYLLLDGSNAMSGNLNRTVGGFQVGLDLASAGINANRVLTVDTNNADRTVSLSGNLTIELNSLINQDLTSDSATARLQTLTLGLNGAGGYVGTLTVADGLNPGSSVSVVHADIDNWNTAYSWGGHAGLYLPIGGGTVTGATTIQGALTIGKNGVGGVAGSIVMLDGNNPGTSFTLDYTELGYVNGLNQVLATTGTPQFARLGLGTPAHATDILTILSADTTASGNVLNISHSGSVTGSHTGINYVGSAVCSVEQIGQSITLTGLSAKNTALTLSASGSATANVALNITAGNLCVGSPTYSAIKLVNILQTSTTANSVGLNILHSGAITGTGYALYASKTGISTLNVGGYFTASGGTANYAIQLSAPATATDYWVLTSNSDNFWRANGQFGCTTLYCAGNAYLFGGYVSAWSNTMIGLRANIANGASAIAVKLGNQVSLTAGTDRYICAFYNDDVTTLKSRINTLGQYETLDTSAAFYVRQAYTSSVALNANRVLTIDMLNADRTLKFGNAHIVDADAGTIVAQFNTLLSELETAGIILSA